MNWINELVELVELVELDELDKWSLNSRHSKKWISIYTEVSFRI